MTAEVNELTDKRTDGWRCGQTASDKGAFWGATPVVQQTYTATAVTAIGTTTITQATTTDVVWGFDSSTAAQALVARVGQLQVDLAAVLSALDTLGIVDAT